MHMTYDPRPSSKAHTLGATPQCKLEMQIDDCKSRQEGILRTVGPTLNPGNARASRRGQDDWLTTFPFPYHDVTRGVRQDTVLRDNSSTDECCADVQQGACFPVPPGYETPLSPHGGGLNAVPPWHTVKLAGAQFESNVPRRTEPSFRITSRQPRGAHLDYNAPNPSLSELPSFEANLHAPLSSGLNYLDHNGGLSQFLQSPGASKELCLFLEHATMEQRRTVLENMRGQVRRLMYHPLGNFIIQRLLELGDAQIRSTLFESLSPSVSGLSQDKYGSWVVQKALNVFQGRELEFLITYISKYALTCVISHFGSYVVSAVVRRCFGRTAALSSVLRPYVADLCCHQHAYHVIQTCAEYDDAYIIKEIVRADVIEKIMAHSRGRRILETVFRYSESGRQHICNVIEKQSIVNERYERIIANGMKTEEGTEQPILQLRKAYQGREKTCTTRKVRRRRRGHAEPATGYNNSAR